MRGPRLTELAASLPSTVPFVGPETQVRQRGRPFAARIGANENGFGPSPAAIDAMRAAAPDIWKYADPENHDLRNALAAHHRVDPENILVGEGIDALLGYLVRLLIGPGDPVVTSAGAYPTFNYHVAGFGGTLHMVPFRGDAEDPVALIDCAARTAAKIVYLSNPDNPMGSWHGAATIQSMIDAVPDGTLLLLDEAYVEFAPEGTAPPLDVSNPAVIRMRTFSKAYGMAGARIGYAIGHAELIRAFDKLRNHFGVNLLAQTGALAALKDSAHLRETIRNVAASREEIGRIASENGLSALPSATNFVAIDCGSDGRFARAVLQGLIARDIFVRMPMVAPQDRCIRVSAGPDRDMAAFAKALPGALEDARAQS